MANAVKVDVKKALELAKRLECNVVLRSGDAKLYKKGTAGSAPSVQLQFGAKSQLIGSIDVVNCLVSSGVPHHNVNKEGWYGTVQQEIKWGDEAECLKRLEDALLDIGEGRAVALKKGGKGDYAPEPREEPEAEEQDEAPVAQAAASVQ